MRLNEAVEQLRCAEHMAAICDDLISYLKRVESGKVDGIPIDSGEGYVDSRYVSDMVRRLDRLKDRYITVLEELGDLEVEDVGEGLSAVDDF